MSYLKNLKKCDVVYICVPTPITKNKVPDVSYIKAATKTIFNNFKRGVFPIKSLICFE